MCEEYNNDRRPLGLTEAETVWYNHRHAVQEAMNNDIYTYGGLLDNMSYAGYIVPQPFGSTGKTILEREFTYEELSFISRCRLHSITMGDLGRLISLLEKFRDKCKTTALDPFGQPMPQQPPVWNNPPYYGGFGGVQTLYGCPVPQNTYEAQKGPNEPDEQEEKQPSFSSSVWNNKPRTIAESLYGMYGVPNPGYVKKYPEETSNVLSAEVRSSKDDSGHFKVVSTGPSTGIVIEDNSVSSKEDETEKKQKDFTELLYGSTSGFPGPVEPGQLKNVSLKAVLDYPSTGIVNNENPVSLTEENKSVDKEDED